MDLDQLRAQTPGCLHRIHLNNAGAALMSRSTLEAMTTHLQLEAEVGGYEAAAQAQEQIDVTYAALAQLVGGRSDEVALFDNSTHAWNAAFYSIPLGPGDRILTGRDEYGSNVLAYLQVAQRSGAEIVVVPDDGDGQIDLGALARLVDERTKLIGLTWVPTAAAWSTRPLRSGASPATPAPCTSWTPPRPSASSPSTSTAWAAIC
jgi:selenocysteine lyase/cysteine desulfurase